MRSMFLVCVALLLGLAGAKGARVGESQSASGLPGGEVVFTRSDASHSHPRLYLTASDGSHQRLLVRNASQAAVSPDGRRIAFVRSGALWAMQRDGSHPVRLTTPTAAPKQGVAPGTSAIEDNGPAWSPDGTKIYFARLDWKIETNSLFVIRADGTGLHRLTRPVITDHGHCQDNPAPSPDGRLIAFAESFDCEHSSDVTINAITAAGRPARLPFAFRGELTSDPAWAPSGQVLAYNCLDAAADMAGRTGVSGLYVSAADGSPTRRLVRGSNLRAPAWSADGKWIVFAGTRGIALESADGTGLRVLTKGVDADPAWLPSLR